MKQMRRMGLRCALAAIGYAIAASACQDSVASNTWENPDDNAPRIESSFEPTGCPWELAFTPLGRSGVPLALIEHSRNGVLVYPLHDFSPEPASIGGVETTYTKDDMRLWRWTAGSGERSWILDFNTDAGRTDLFYGPVCDPGEASS